MRISEPPRDCERLHFLRGWSHGANELDLALRTGDTDEIRRLMAECRGLINRFLVLTHPVLEDLAAQME